MPIGDVLDAETERIATAIVDAIYRVHKNLGPGLLESVYVQCLVIELEAKGIKVVREVMIPIVYSGRKIEPGFPVDLLVEDKIVVEAKAVEALKEIHYQITRTYLKLSGRQLGFLVNFNVLLIKDGIKRILSTSS